MRLQKVPPPFARFVVRSMKTMQEMFTFSSQFNGSALTSTIGLLPSHLVLVKLMDIFSNSPSRDDLFSGIARKEHGSHGTFNDELIFFSRG